MNPPDSRASDERPRRSLRRWALGLLKIPAALLLLSAAVSAHEFGHLLAGKAVGIHAEAFSVGFGPSMFKAQIGDTEYRLSWILAGGYVRFPGEAKQGETQERTPFESQPVWKRLTAIGAGPISSVLFGVLLFAAFAFFNGLSNAAKKKKKKLAAENKSSASPPPQERNESDSSSVGTVSLTADILKETFTGMGRVIVRKESTDSISGPIGIVNMIQKEMTGGWSWSALTGICLLTGCVSVGLAAFNLLPIPPLDGGKMALLLIEAGVGRPLNATLLNVIEYAGMFVLIYFIFWITGKEIRGKRKK